MDATDFSFTPRNELPAQLVCNNRTTTLVYNVAEVGSAPSVALQSATALLYLLGDPSRSVELTCSVSDGTVSVVITAAKITELNVSVWSRLELAITIVLEEDDFELDYHDYLVVTNRTYTNPLRLTDLYSIYPESEFEQNVSAVAYSLRRGWIATLYWLRQQHPTVQIWRLLTEGQLSQLALLFARDNFCTRMLVADESFWKDEKVRIGKEIETTKQSLLLLSKNSDSVGSSVELQQGKSVSSGNVYAYNGCGGLL